MHVLIGNMISVLQILQDMQVFKMFYAKKDMHLFMTSLIHPCVCVHVCVCVPVLHIGILYLALVMAFSSRHHGVAAGHSS